MLEDMLNRILLREYLDVIKLALFGGSSIELNNTLCSMEEDSQDTRTNTSEVISELGLRLLHCDPSCQAITLTLLRLVTLTTVVCTIFNNYLDTSILLHFI